MKQETCALPFGPSESRPARSGDDTRGRFHWSVLCGPCVHCTPTVELLGTSCRCRRRLSWLRKLASALLLVVLCLFDSCAFLSSKCEVPMALGRLHNVLRSSAGVAGARGWRQGLAVLGTTSAISRAKPGFGPGPGGPCCKASTIAVATSRVLCPRVPPRVATSSPPQPA